jgi:hypothetical protein
VTPAQWRMATRVEAILGTVPGMSEKALAGRGLIERCGPDYLILAAQPAPARGDAG